MSIRSWEIASSCGEVAPTGEHLVFLFCGEPVIGSYALTSEQLYRCPVAAVLAIIETDGGADLAAATAGTLTIARTGACISGSYTAIFGADQLTGTFDAVVCP